ncbi:MAG TPA: hypothetical protein VNY73_00050, partial [Bacteroidia bacterium]|nr:hypothetical protein [Bacteroidia bacterium]
PLRHMLSQIIKVYEQNWEGLAYIGISSLFAFLYLPFLLFSRRKQLRSFIEQNKNTRTLLILAVSSVILLVFSMGYPFKWGMQWILDMIPLIEQFRSPGRFAWVFYYVATIASTIILSKYFLLKVNAYLSGILVSVILLLFMVEGLPFHQQIKTWGFSKNCFNEHNLDEELKQVCAAIDKVKPQAIIPLPFFHMGTDYFCFNATEKIKTATFITAFHTGTPVLGNCTDRTSINEARAEIQLVGSSLLRKEMSKFIHSDKPFCVLYSKEKLEEGEAGVLDRGRTLLETQNFIVKEILPAELFKDDIAMYMQCFKENEKNKVFVNELYQTEKSYVRYVGYDSLRGTLVGNLNEKCVLADIAQNALEKDKVYELGFWYDLLGKDELANTVIVEEIGVNGVVTDTLAKKSCSQMPNIAGNRLLALVNFKTSNPQNKIRVSLTGGKDNRGIFRLDNLLIRRKDVDVYQINSAAHLKEGGKVRVNNFEISNR